MCPLCSICLPPMDRTRVIAYVHIFLIIQVSMSNICPKSYKIYVMCQNRGEIFIFILHFASFQQRGQCMSLQGGNHYSQIQPNHQHNILNLFSPHAGIVDIPYGKARRGSFSQARPELGNTYVEDGFLQSSLRRLVPKEVGRPRPAYKDKQNVMRSSKMSLNSIK